MYAPSGTHFRLHIRESVRREEPTLEDLCAERGALWSPHKKKYAPRERDPHWEMYAPSEPPTAAHIRGSIRRKGHTLENLCAERTHCRAHITGFLRRAAPGRSKVQSRLENESKMIRCNVDALPPEVSKSLLSAELLFAGPFLVLISFLLHFICLWNHFVKK